MGFVQTRSGLPSPSRSIQTPLAKAFSADPPNAPELFGSSDTVNATLPRDGWRNGLTGVYPNDVPASIASCPSALLLTMLINRNRPAVAVSISYESLY